MRRQGARARVLAMNEPVRILRGSSLRPARARLAPLLLCCLGLAAVPAAANASNVTVSSSALTVTAPAGEDNRMSIDCKFSFGGTSTCVVEDFEGITESSDLCTKTDTYEVTCAGDPMASAPNIDLGDLDDFLAITSDNYTPFNIKLGAGDDTLYGADGGGGDTIYGGTGNDWLEGQYGGDTIRGQAGRDTIIGGSGYNVIHGDGGNDTLMSGAWLGTGSQLNGGAGNDHLVGGVSADALRGGLGNDLLDGGPANDDLDGDEDFDTVDYADSDGPITVTFDGQPNDGSTADGGSGGTIPSDMVRTSVEQVLGSEHADEMTAAGPMPVTFIGNGGNDVLVGSNVVDTIRGGDGNDRIDGKLGGDDLDGGPGGDTADYHLRSNRLTVRLDNVRNDGADPNNDLVSDGSEEGDLLTDFEHAWTGSGPDFLRGNALLNKLTSGAGSDRIRSRDATAVVDVVSCGADADTFDADASDTTSGCETAGNLP